MVTEAISRGFSDVHTVGSEHSARSTIPGLEAAARCPSAVVPGDTTHRALGGRSPSAAELDSLPYLSMVVEETLRLYPPAYATSRRLVGGDDEIGGCRIPDRGDVAVYPLSHPSTPASLG